MLAHPVACSYQAHNDKFIDSSLNWNWDVVVVVVLLIEHGLFFEWCICIESYDFPCMIESLTCRYVIGFLRMEDKMTYIYIYTDNFKPLVLKEWNICEMLSIKFLLSSYANVYVFKYS